MNVWTDTTGYLPKYSMFGSGHNWLPTKETTVSSLLFNSKEMSFRNKAASFLLCCASNIVEKILKKILE